MSASLAVALFIYRRPQHTQRVFNRIREARPGRLFVIADGPGGPADAAELAAARQVTESVDWDCRVERDYASTHMGCGRRVTSGIASVLAEVNEAVFLEDDCCPDATFFGFCSGLLQRYRDDSGVMMISGYNPLASDAVRHASYGFTRFGSVWGWASWARAMAGYDRELSCWDDPAVLLRFRGALGEDSAFEYYRHMIDRVRTGHIDTWDYQWTVQRVLAGGLCIVPRCNLVENSGFGREATHRGRANPLHSEVRARPLQFPLSHPVQVALDSELDQRMLAYRMGQPQAPDLLAAASRLLDAGRSIQSLALALTGRERFPSDTRFVDLQATALRKIGKVNPGKGD